MTQLVSLISSALADLRQQVPSGGGSLLAGRDVLLHVRWRVRMTQLVSLISSALADLRQQVPTRG
jgi:hypothetical protein